MGQSSSTQRDPLEVSRHRSRQSSSLVGGRQEASYSDGRVEPQNQPLPTSAAPSTPARGSHSSQPFATFSRQISAQAIPGLRARSGNDRDVSTRDDIFYEQHEQRPPTAMEDMGIRSAPITHITASPMPRRSRLSRLGSIIMPQHASNRPSRGRVESHDTRDQARRRLNEEDSHSRRSSMFASLNFGHSTQSRSRHRGEITPISLPLPMSSDTTSPHSTFDSMPPSTVLPDPELPTNPDTRTVGFFTSPLSARFSRVRRSITSQFDIVSPASNALPDLDLNDQPLRPPRGGSNDDQDYLLPSMSLTDTAATSLNTAVLNAANRDPRPFEMSTVSGSPERAVGETDNPNLTERLTDRGQAGRRETRRVTSVLRGRTSRLIRRDSEGPLPRILNLAASTIAAQLSGNHIQAMPSIQHLGLDDLNGSLQNLFRAVQHASDVAEDDHIRGNTTGNTQAESTPPLNFLRVFRFVSRSTFSPQPNESSVDGMPGPTELAESQAEATTTANEAQGRTVTLVVVGVRSVPPENVRAENVRHEDMSAPSPAIDSTYELPPLAENMNLVRSNTGGLLRHTSIRSRLPHRRRASIGGLTSFPAQYDSQRHHRISSSSRSSSGVATPITGSATPPFSESPPGPRPPPSTPAEHALSAISSQATTPSRRLSTISALQYPPIFDRDSSIQFPLHEDGAVHEESPYHSVQQRRRSDSESARHRDLGAGAARRNGVVEPDELETGDNPPSGTRSWLIYVVGTNLSEDHPALTTPSLLTEVSERRIPGIQG
ncbi:MAG: hypothetical protein Q9217_000556 [Psora testacea]